MTAIALTLLLSTAAAEASPVQKYLDQGQYATGEHALTLALAAEPANDSLRFGLGLLQAFAAVNNFGQSMHEYGLRDRGNSMPFLRLPVPENNDPTPVTYTAFRRVLEVFQADLAKADTTLAAIKDDQVKLPLKLSGIKFDFTRDGKASESLLPVLARITGGQQFEFLLKNPSFLVYFDRGDVAWFRAYAHVLMGVIDLYLALDTEDDFDRHADSYFGKPLRTKPGRAVPMAWEAMTVKEPARFGSFRKHFVLVCQLNRETWRHIRAETDDDYEWLPNAKQKGVIGLPVTDVQIDTWLAMMTELEALLEGKKVLAESVLRMAWKDIDGGLDFKKLLDDPPAKFEWQKIAMSGPQPKYLDKAKPEANLNALMAAFRMFDSPYMAWFN